MRRLRQIVAEKRVRGKNTDPSEVLDEVTAALRKMGVFEDDVVSVNVSYRCVDNDMLSDAWYATAAAVYWHDA